MNRIFTFLILMVFGLSSIQVSAQQSHAIPEFHIYDLNTKKTVHRVPIFPGCDVVMSNKQLMTCFQKNISSIYLHYLDTTQPKSKKKTLNVTLKFTITNRGEIDKIAYHDGDKELLEQAIEAMEKTAVHLKENNLKIEPAVMESGKPVDVYYYMPITLSQK